MRIAIACLASLALAGCSQQKSSVLGKAPVGGQIVAVNQLKPAAAPVMLHGTMIEKCPVAGCWFMLRDKTGVVKVDTKHSGFTVTNVPVNAEVTVAGTVKETGERIVVASGMSY